MAPVPLLWPTRISSASQGTDGTAMGLRVDVGIRANGNTGEDTGLTSPALVVSLAIFGLSFTMLSIFGRRMYAARHRHRGQGMEQQTDSETREDRYLFLADMLGLDLGHMRGGMPQLPLIGDKPKLWNLHATPCGVETRMERPLCWDDITPIAAVVSQEETCCVRDTTNPAPSPAPRHMTDRRMCCCHRRTPVRRAIQDEQQGRGEEESRVPLPHKSIQVAVAITMPCRSGQVSRGGRDAAMDYSIGVHEIPWDYA
ncbi:hypothetical protein F5887DRAFT_1019595 [Amanita rubescens]|nr:hypothetical protein F5887DRAFT_1021232 [Amanita rubescens]KAF8325339.1 hypothetical protein F5887DRAFT_1019595 [Amanita rubescens]